VSIKVARPRRLILTVNRAALLRLQRAARIFQLKAVAVNSDRLHACSCGNLRRDGLFSRWSRRSVTNFRLKAELRASSEEASEEENEWSFSLKRQ